MSQKETVMIGFLSIDIERKNNKHMYLKVKQNGSVYITAPLEMPYEKIAAFVWEKRDWIERQLSTCLNPAHLEKKEQITFDSLQVVIERKSIKNTYLRVKEDGNLLVTAPPNMTQEVIMKFLKSKQAWIQQKRVEKLQSPRLSLKENEVLLFSKPLTYRYQRGIQAKVSLEEGQLLIQVPSHFSKEQAQRLLKQWLFEQLQHKVNVLIDHYWPFFEAHGLTPVEIKYRQMKSTWGVCRPALGNITFNKQLIEQPEAFVVYVVVHELCHLIQPNHSANFYKVVEALLPQWKAYSKQKI